MACRPDVHAGLSAFRLLRSCPVRATARFDPQCMVRPASQENSPSGLSVLHQCIWPLIGAVHRCRPPWASALDLISGQTSNGSKGSTVFDRAGKTVLHRALLLAAPAQRDPLAGREYGRTIPILYCGLLVAWLRRVGWKDSVICLVGSLIFGANHFILLAFVFGSHGRFRRHIVRDTPAVRLPLTACLVHFLFNAQPFLIMPLITWLAPAFLPGNLS
jgi:hypothetical protein